MGQGKVSGLQHRILVRSQVYILGNLDLEVVRLPSRLPSPHLSRQAGL